MKRRHLVLFLIYTVVVLAVGAKFGAFRGWPFRKPVIERAKRLDGSQSSSLDNLPEGNLTFDAELKKASVSEGTAQANFVFNLTNISRRALVIEQVKTSCGCTVAKLPVLPWTLKPGSVAQIPVVMNVLGHTGKDSKTVTVFTDKGKKILTVEANIEASSVAATMGDRERNATLAKADRQAVFRGECAKCHADPADGKNGRELYGAVCGICHDATARATMVPNLREMNHPANGDFWRALITNGKANTLMPAFAANQGGPLSDAQIESLVAYLTSSTFTPPPTTKSN